MDEITANAKQNFQSAMQAVRLPVVGRCRETIESSRRRLTAASAMRDERHAHKVL
jgi:hypothetical protein